MEYIKFVFQGLISNMEHVRFMFHQGKAVLLPLTARMAVPAITWMDDNCVNIMEDLVTIALLNLLVITAGQLTPSLQ